MARPKRQADELFYDQFYAMDLAEQSIALRIMTEHHRLASKDAKKKPVSPEKEGNQ
jgi:hypothetical protein